jgi:hypothetical protein
VIGYPITATQWQADEAPERRARQPGRGQEDRRSGGALILDVGRWTSTRVKGAWKKDT